MLRTWSEHLPFEDARQPEVLDLLEHGAMHPLFAVAPEADLDALALLIEAVRARGLEPGVWPLLRDEQGYWPSERNAPAYLARLEDVLGWLERARVLPGWVAVDLEPPLFQIERLRYELSAPAELARQLGGNLDRARFARVVSAYERLAERMRARGVRTLAVTLPMAAHDLRDGAPLWQDALEAPWAPVPWDRAGIMAYGSMVAGYSRGWLSAEDARAIHYRLLEHLARALGPRAHAVRLGARGARALLRGWRAWVAKA